MRHWRSNLLLLVFLFCGATILSRLLFLQVQKHSFYEALAVGQQITGELAQGRRGEIFFRDGTPLASNKKGEYVFISPREIKNKEETAQELVDILELDFKGVLARAQKSNLFEPLKHDITKQEAEALKQKNLPGVYVQEEIFRYYPQEEMAAHIVGFVGGEGAGQYGIEGYYDELLKGKEAVITKTSGPLAFFSGFRETDTSGADIITTLDPVLQFIARKALLDNKDLLDFQSGQVIIMEPGSGEILAFAQVPSFDPNHYSEIKNVEIFQNSAIQKAYEPGSVFKPITMAAAIEEGKVTPETTYIDTGTVWVGQTPIKNYHEKVWGEQTMTNVLEQSINTGAIFAERELGHHSFWEYIKRFGFLEETGIELQGELLPQNKEIQMGREISFITAAFGQGIELTPIQLIRAFTVFANKGKMVSPYIVKSVASSAPELSEHGSGKQVISEKTALTITSMLVSVVDKGSARRAGIKDYQIAGKTGTAQIAWPALGVMDKKGYSDKTAQTFIGFAPAFDPAFLIMIKLDAPQTETTEQSAVPMFNNMAQEIIDLWEIPPSE